MTSIVQFPYSFPKKNADSETSNIMLPAALNRKPCRRALVLFLVLVIIPFSGRLFYAHKLEFARRVSLRLEEARRENSTTSSLAMMSRKKKMHTFQNEDDDDKEKREQQKQQQQQLHEDEEKRLLEGNPLGDV